jgi:hypothetical protein
MGIGKFTKKFGQFMSMFRLLAQLSIKRDTLPIVINSLIKHSSKTCHEAA